MADINYDLNYSVELGPPPGGNEVPEAQTFKIVQWLIDRTEVIDNKSRINFFNLTRIPFATLGTTCTLLALLRQNLLGAKWALQAASKRLVMADNITACNTMLHAKLTDAIRAGQLMEFVYHLGHVRLEMATAYTDFRNVILLLLQLVKWMECIVCNSISLVKAYQGFLQAVDPFG